MKRLIATVLVSVLPVSGLAVEDRYPPSIHLVPWFAGENSTLPHAACGPGQAITGIGNWDFGGGAQSAYFTCTALPPGATFQDSVEIVARWTPGEGKKPFALCTVKPGGTFFVATKLKLIDAGDNNQYVGLVTCSRTSALSGSLTYPIYDVEWTPGAGQKPVVDCRYNDSGEKIADYAYVVGIANVDHGNNNQSVRQVKCQIYKPGT